MVTENQSSDVKENSVGAEAENSAPRECTEQENSEEQVEKEPDVQKKVKRVGLAALILSMGILCSRLLGYVREAVIAYQAGAGSETDAYNAAFMLPDMMNHFLAGGTLSITFIPLFAGYIAKNDPRKADRLFSLIATTMGTFLIGATIICWVFATPIAQILFSGFNAEQIARTVEMTRIILPGQIFHYIGGLMMAVLMARGQFVPSAIAPLIYNLSIIVLGVLLSGFMGMEGFAYGALAGAFLGPFLLPLVYLRKKVSYKPVFGFKDPDFKKYILLTLPLLLGVSLTTVDEWIGRMIGSSMAEGSISWLNYARRLMLVPIAIVGQAAGQAALPYLSQLSAKGEFDKAADTLHKTLRNVIILSMVMIGFFVVLAEPMVSLVYERGRFTAEDAARTAAVLRILAASIVFWTIQMVSVRAFYAAQNTLRPMVITTVVTALSIPVYLILSKGISLPGIEFAGFDLNGLAIASCIGMALQASSIVLFYHRMNAHFKPGKIVRYLCMGVLFGLLSGCGSYAGLKLVGLMSIESHTWRILFELGVSGCLGALLASVAAYFIIPDLFKAFTGKIKRKLLRR